MSRAAHWAARDKRVFALPAAPGDRAGIAAAVDDLFCLLPAAARLGPDTRVLVKPNLLSKNAPEKAVTTHPDVLRAVLMALKKRGVRDIVVADSPGGPYTPSSMRSLYTGCGISAVCQELGVEAYTACETVTRPVPQGAGVLAREFELLKPVAEADFIINLPKMKTHVLTGLSGATKNLFGCVPGLRKAEFHMQFPEKPRFADMLVDLCETLQPDMSIVDGIVAMEGDGPGSGNPRVCGRLYAGEDPYTLDLALCKAIGLGPMEAPLTAAAHARGLCPAVLDEALLVAQGGAAAPVEGFVPPRSYEGRVDFAGTMPPFLRPLMPMVARWAAPKPRIARKACIGCGKCAQICPQKVITIRKQKAGINYKDCIHCFCCHEMCPVKAVKVKRNKLFGLF